MSTSAQLPMCVYCGTPRPADRSRCPQCGRPWIDVRVGDLAAAKAHALVGAAATAETPNLSALSAAALSGASAAEPFDTLTVDLTGDLAAAPDPAAPPGFPRIIPILLGASALLVLVMFALGLLDPAQPEPPASPTVTSAASATSTAPPTTAAATTVPPTTTLPPTTTVPTTLPEPAAIGVWGDPVELARLTLKADGIGPIAVGAPASEAIGRLVASLGTPEQIGAVDDPSCPVGLFVRWAGLSAFVAGNLGEGTFVGYRYEEPAVPTYHIDLATPSGIRLGDDLATLNEVYASYTLAYETDGEASTFRLSEGDELLLWGPVSSTETSGRVEGIYSPSWCG